MRRRGSVRTHFVFIAFAAWERRAMRRRGRRPRLSTSVRKSGWRGSRLRLRLTTRACRRDFVTDRSFANPRLNSETHSTRFAPLAFAQGRLWGSHFRGGANEILATGHQVREVRRGAGRASEGRGDGNRRRRGRVRGPDAAPREKRRRNGRTPWRSADRW